MICDLDGLCCGAMMCVLSSIMSMLCFKSVTEERTSSTIAVMYINMVLPQVSSRTLLTKYHFDDGKYGIRTKLKCQRSDCYSKQQGTLVMARL